MKLEPRTPLSVALAWQEKALEAASNCRKLRVQVATHNYGSTIAPDLAESADVLEQHFQKLQTKTKAGLNTKHDYPDMSTLDADLEKAEERLTFGQTVLKSDLKKSKSKKQLQPIADAAGGPSAE